MRIPLPAMLTLACACTALPQTYTLKTFAGGGLPENVAATSASLGTVTGLAWDRTGGLYLSLGDYHMVARLDTATGQMVRVAGNGSAGFAIEGGPCAGAQLSAPAGLAVDSAGNLYVADSGNSRVRVIARGVISSFAGFGARGYGGDGDSALSARYDGPSAVAADAAGNVYIADFFNHVVRKVSGGKVTTVAGDGTYGMGAENVDATRSALAGPAGLAVDAAGNLYIAEFYNNRVRKVSGGVITTVAGTGTAGFSGDKAPAAAATLRQPTDVAVDSAGVLYIADFGNNRVRMVSGGLITTVAGNGTTSTTGDGGAATSAGLSAPRRVAFDGAGIMYIADGMRVRKVTKGVIANAAGGGVPAGENGPAAGAQLLTPQAVAVDSTGNVYVSDSGTGRVLKIAGGTLVRLAGTGVAATSTADGAAATTALGAPSAVTVDAAGTLYVADTVSARVRKIAAGQMTTVVGGGTSFGDGGPPLKAQLTAPEGLAVNTAGDLFIADVNRVRAVSGGVITTFAGNGSVGYQGDNGAAMAARLSSPSGLAVDSAGNVLIADTGNSRLRMVAAGVISTVAGNGTYGFGGSGGTATSAGLGYPMGVAVDGAGDLYITDEYRVMKVSKGKIATVAGFAGPRGIAVDGSGNVYVADPSNHRVAVLNPAGTSCAVTVSPAAPQYPASGGQFTLSVRAGAGCPWVLDNLPAWMVPAKLYGEGATDVAATVDANMEAPRTASLMIGGQTVGVTQAGVATISGVITATSGKPLAGVTVTLGGAGNAKAVTDGAGNYQFADLPSGAAYSVTPSLAGYGFVPATATFTTLSATPSANFMAWSAPKINGVRAAFAAAPPATFAAGEIVSIYGANLCGDPPASAAPTLPDRLASCMARVDNTAIRLYYASATQINAVLPQTLAEGAHQLVVQRYTTTAYTQLAAQSEAFSFTVGRIAMAFVETAGTVTVQYANGEYASDSRPVHPGDAVVLYLTGLGRKVRTVGEGAAPVSAIGAVEQVKATVEGQPATLSYAGTQPQFPGLDQMILILPKYTLPAGKRTVTLEITAVGTGQSVRYEVAGAQ